MFGLLTLVCYLYRSTATGNCLYSSVSLVLVGDNSLVQNLRVLTSIELFIDAPFYSHHPCFLSAVNKHAELFSNLNNLLPWCVSKECLDTGATKDDLVRQEAILNCFDGKWSSFLCILGLSSALNRNIFTYYPDCGQLRCKLLFSCMVKPRANVMEGMHDLHVLFCYEGIMKSGEIFQPNHFVPLLFHPHQQKRKPATVPLQMPTLCKRQKHISKNVSKKSDCGNITQFFNAAQKPVANLAFHKAPNESFSSVAELNKLDIDKPSTSTNTQGVLHAGTNKIEIPIGENPQNVKSNFDIAFFKDKVKGMGRSDICNLIKNVFRPDKHYSFPKTNGRSFRYEWLELHSWLCYSPSENGAYCLSCVLFGHRFSGKAARILKLFSEPLCRWSGAAYAFKRHAGHGTGGKWVCMHVHFPY